MTDRAAVERMVERTEAKLGPINILVNNAGIGFFVADASRASWEDDPDEQWRTVEVNFRGPYLCTRAVLPSMVDRRSGRIINVARVAGIQGFTRAHTYGSSKTMLIRWTETLANETRPYGVLVFAFEPGIMKTRMVDEGVAQGFTGLQVTIESGRGSPI